jgi:filamentous hemagglutinin
MLEVAGQKAEVIIANPWGISVSGGAGFINTSQATLTTGTPLLSNGTLTGYQVRGGSVSIDGTADVSNLDGFTILSRALQVNAGLYASKLNVVLGSNQISKDTLQATPITGDNNAPTLALDVAQLGGMYAGVIKLVGTEAGVGVNSRGQLIASQGMQLNSAGDLTLSGSTSTQGDLQIQAAGLLDNSGTTSAVANLAATAGGQALLNGTLTAGNNLAVVAATVNRNGTVASGVQPDGTLSGSGSLSITASQQFMHSGRLLAAGNTTLQGSSLILDHATVSSLNGNTALNSQGDISTQSATVTAANTLTLQTATLLNNQQGVMSAQQFDVRLAVSTTSKANCWHWAIPAVVSSQ